MTRLTTEQKKMTSGGSFYAVALGIGILVSTISSLVTNIVCATTSNNNQQSSYASRRSATIMRLSPVPTRSSISIIG